VAGSAVIVVGAATTGIVLASTGGSQAAVHAGKGSTTTTTPATSTSSAKKKTTTTTPPLNPHLCPLTGLEAPGGVVPDRPALAVKVGNDPAARPQSGLQDADVVFDTLAEGGIVRYIAVFQCHSSSDIGPVRSVRYDDWHVLQQFGHVDLAFVHGIDPDVDTVASLHWICDLDDFSHSNDYFNPVGRYPPEDTYTSTAALYSSCPNTGKPPPLFTYSTAVPPGAGPLAAVQIVYNPDESDIVWRWSAARLAWLHFYNDDGYLQPDIDSQGVQLQATNVVIEKVNITYGTQEETPDSTGDVQAQTTGEGTAYIMRNGKVIPCKWVRPTLADITYYVNASGARISLQPGTTWVELVPTWAPVTWTA
jgi:Protein of unknown function (DUF3048) N-terminal domain/Protein of unknown function (DUF3048) C-terminal domain